MLIAARTPNGICGYISQASTKKVVSKIPELPHLISTQVRYGVARASKYSRTWMQYNSVTYFCRFQYDFHDCHCSIDHKPPKYFEAPCIRGRGVVPLWLLSFV